VIAGALARELAKEFGDVLAEQAEQYLPNTIWQKCRGRFQIHLKTDLPSQIPENPAAIPESERYLCVPKTLSVLIQRRNRVT
jgi:hypothetical protein